MLMCHVDVSCCGNCANLGIVGIANQISFIWHAISAISLKQSITATPDLVSMLCAINLIVQLIFIYLMTWILPELMSLLASPARC